MKSLSSLEKRLARAEAIHAPVEPQTPIEMYLQCPDDPELFTSLGSGNGVKLRRDEIEGDFMIVRARSGRIEEF